jgi:hypothetical protein
MSRGKVLGIGAIVLFALALVGGYLFYAKTGGEALSRVVWHYFFRNLPDKQYGWRDFTDRGSGHDISGFYAWGSESRFYLWTLSGIKAFTHVEGVSVYMHQDICAAVRAIEGSVQGEGSPVPAPQEIGGIAYWQTLIKQENLVTVRRLDDPSYRNGVDKVWSYSGRYKVLNQLERDSCD